MRWEVTLLGVNVARAIGYEEGFRLLSRYGLQTWSQGGCAVLAAALVETLEAEPWTVVVAGAPHHVVVKVSGAFLDADGAYSRAELLRKFQALETPPGRADLVPGLITPGLACPAQAVRELVTLLEEAGVGL